MAALGPRRDSSEGRLIAQQTVASTGDRTDQLAKGAGAFSQLAYPGRLDSGALAGLLCGR